MRKSIYYITRYKFVFLAVVLETVLISCSQNDTHIQNEIEKMMRSEVVIDIDSLEMFDGADKEFIEKHNSAKMNWIVYFDSVACNPCKIKSLQSWNDYIQISKENNYAIGFYFIFRKSNYGVDVEKIKEAMAESNLMCPIFVDSDGCFLRQNATIPKEALYHTFLTDENWCPILVGNPLGNLDINDLFYKILKERIPLYKNGN